MRASALGATAAAKAEPERGSARGSAAIPQLLNALRGHLTEVGVIAPQGLRYARELAKLIEACDETVPFEVGEALAPGQVLLSSTVKDLVAGPGLSFRDHRAAALKGVQGEWKLYAAEG